MYDFFYNVVIKYYPNAKLLYMDTDSFIIEFPDTLEGFSKFIIKNREHFDLSGCDNTDIPLYHHLQEMKARLSRRNTTYTSIMEHRVSSRAKHWKFGLL